MPRQVPETLDQVERELDTPKPDKADKRKLEKKLGYERGPDGLYFVTFSAGGEVPDSLKGRYTNVRRVEDAIRTHEAQTQAKQAAA